MNYGKVLVALFVFVALSATVSAYQPSSFCSGWGCDRTPSGQNAQGQGQQQADATISQAGGQGNSASIIQNNYYGATTQVPIPTLPQINREKNCPEADCKNMPVIQNDDTCTQTATEFRETVSNFFVSDENKAFLLTADTFIPGYQSFLDAVSGVRIGSIDMNNKADRTKFTVAIRAIWNGPIVEINTYQYGWVVVIFATADHNGRTIECCAIDTNPETGEIRIENPEGWVRIEGSSATPNVPKLENRYRAMELTQAH